jgi:DNA-binding NarL/FixJ family response regulator
MTRVFLAAPRPDARTALRLLLLDSGMEVSGEAADWPAALALAPVSQPDMLLVDWDLVTTASGNSLAQLRAVCPAAAVIVLISHLDARQQAALCTGADAFISKGELPDRIAARLQAAAEQVNAIKGPNYFSDASPTF